MKKILLTIIALVLVLTPLTVKAVSIDDYNTLDLEQALSLKDIKKNFKEIKKNNNQIPVYVFFGYSCPHCEELLKYLNEMYPEYADKIDIILFETYQDTQNDSLLSDVAEFFGYGRGEYGVPFMIIGDKEFIGYTSAKNSEIETAINELYDTKKEDRYDLFTEMNKPADETPSSSGISTGGVIIIALVSVAIVIIYDTIRFNILQNEVMELSKKKIK